MPANKEREDALAEARKLARQQAAEAQAKARQQAADAEAQARKEAAERRAERLQSFFDTLFAEVARDVFPVELFFRLQDAAVYSQYVEVFGENPSVTALRKRFSLSSTVYRTLCDARQAASDAKRVAVEQAKAERARALEAQREATRVAREAAAVERAWHNALIHAAQMPTHLGITKAEFDAWRANGRIPVSKREKFRKWGQTLETTLHHPDAIAHITPELITSWREQDHAALSPRAKKLREASVARATTTKQVTDTFSTDAIGMGLNLPIRRVVFSTVHKYDGKRTRQLNVMEVNQIAGRAGRFGMHEAGFVNALDHGDRDHIQAMLHCDPFCGLERLPITASLWHVERLSELLGTTSIGPILRFFASRISVQSPLFEADAMRSAVQIAALVDQLAAKLPLKKRYTLACAPVNADKPETAYFMDCLRALAHDEVMPLPARPGWLVSNKSGNLEAAEVLSKEISLYAWLSFKFPRTFTNNRRVAGVACRREQIHRAGASQARWVWPDQQGSVRVEAAGVCVAAA